MRSIEDAETVPKGGVSRADHGSRPIWMAALIAVGCQAVCDDREHPVRWQLSDGRAVYCNAGTKTELIQPLGVRLQSGHTLVLHWAPAKTTYTIETYGQTSPGGV